MQLCINFSKIDSEKGRENTKKSVEVLIPRLVDRARLDDEHGVATAAMDGFLSLIKELKFEVVAKEGHLEAIINCVTEVMEGWRTFLKNCKLKSLQNFNVDFFRGNGVSRQRRQ